MSTRRPAPHALPPPQPGPPAAKAAAVSLQVATALDRSEPLAQLLRRLQEARDHFDAITPLLPPNLRADTRPGPVDGDCWTLLAAHNAAAAKVRQLLPLLLQRLQERGWQGTSIKVRVQPRATPRATPPVT